MRMVSENEKRQKRDAAKRARQIKNATLNGVKDPVKLVDNTAMLRVLLQGRKLGLPIKAKDMLPFAQAAVAAYGHPDAKVILKKIERAIAQGQE